MTGRNALDSEMTRYRRDILDLMRNELRVGAEEGFGCVFEFDSDGRRGCDRRGELIGGRKGDWAYVGHQYGKAQVGGRPARILFVSMDRNRLVTSIDRDTNDDDPVSWTFETVQNQYRNACGQGDPHMNGVGRRMQFLLGADVPREEYSQQFALVNAVLCGRRSTSTGSTATGTMKNNCRKHGVRIVQSLEPDIVVAQGMGHPTGLVEVFETETIRCWSGKGAPRVSRGESDGRPFWIVITSHPGFYRRGLCGRERMRSGAADLLPRELEEAFDLVRNRFSRGGEVGS